MERVIGTLCALTVLGICAGASAEPKPRTSTRGFIELADSDGDARVTADELERLVVRHVLEQSRKRFSHLDRNSDGRVSRAEVPTMTASRFARFDLNADNYFTLGELARVMREQARRHCAHVLARFDRDGDGAVSLADIGSDQRAVELELARGSHAASIK